VEDSNEMIKKKKHYIKSDGNGGFNVSKSIAYLTVLTLLVTMITSVTAVTTYTVTNRERISSLEDNMVDCKTNIVANHAYIESINREIIRATTQIEHLDNNIQTLSKDLKEFVNKN
jgi:peptidoglycan hydrolase CwlO-like protein